MESFRTFVFLSCFVTLVMLQQTVGTQAQGSIWIDVGSEHYAVNFNISYQTPSTFSPPGQDITVTGQYTLAKFSINDLSMYTEFQNQAYSTIFNPPCDNILFGDPQTGTPKECYTYNYAGASQEQAYTDVSHLTLPYTSSNWSFSVPESARAWYSPFGNSTIVYVVRFGASGQYVYHKVSGSYMCYINYLGDPLPGVTKTCEVLNHQDNFLSTSNTAQNDNMVSVNSANGVPMGTWVYCSLERSNCVYNLTTQTPTYIRFGMVTDQPNTGTIIRQVDTAGTFPCSLTSFMVDPAPGYVKSCWFFQPNVKSGNSLATGSWQYNGPNFGGSYGVNWENSESYTTINSTQYSYTLRIGVEEAFQVTAGFLGNSSTTIFNNNTETYAWLSSTAWLQATQVSTLTPCSYTGTCSGTYSGLTCSGSNYQWKMTGGLQQNTIGGVTAPAAITTCIFTCVPTNAVPICMPGTCSKTCPVSPNVASDACCYCTEGSPCDFSVCNYYSLLAPDNNIVTTNIRR